MYKFTTADALASDKSKTNCISLVQKGGIYQVASCHGKQRSLTEEWIDLQAPEAWSSRRQSACQRGNIWYKIWYASGNGLMRLVREGACLKATTTVDAEVSAKASTTESLP